MDRRRLVFRAELFDELEKVGEGMNERFIVDRDRHEQRLGDKVARWRRGRSSPGVPDPTRID
jgi:predicted thioesterase